MLHALLLLTAALPPFPVTTPEPADAHPGLTTPDPLDLKYPLPRNPKRKAELVAQRRAWYARQLNGDLAKFPPRPGTDKAVKEAVDAQVEELANPGGRNGPRLDRRDDAVNRASGTGATKYLQMLYPFRRYVSALGAEPGWIGKAASTFHSDNYSVFRRFHAGWNAAAEACDKTRRQATDAELEVFWTALTDLCKDPDPTAVCELAEVCQLTLTSHVLGPDAAARHRRLADKLTAVGASAWLRKCVDGWHHINWGWEARGTGTADTVSDDGWRLFNDRLGKAETLLKEAHDLAPLRPEAATGLVLTCKALGQDRAEMEKWFRRALAADPNHTSALWHKLDYLEPKWHGSREEMLAYARQCLRASDGDDLLNRLLTDTYLRFQQADRSLDVYAQPGVWADLRAAYEPLLAVSPLDRWTHCQMFRVCMLCGQYEAAAGHRKIIGTRWAYAEFVDKNEPWRLSEQLDAKLKEGRGTP